MIAIVAAGSFLLGGVVGAVVLACLIGIDRRGR